MRIVDEWTHKDLRVSVFHMNGRYSVKLEQGLLEQTYKFRDGQVENPQQLKELLSEEFYDSSQNLFIHMGLAQANLFAENNEEEDFAIII